MDTPCDYEKKLPVTMMKADFTDETLGIDKLREPELYRYPKLSIPDQCIRLLKLQPGAGERENICELVEYNLSDKSEICYEALSWCWGKGTRNKKLTIRCGASSFSSMVPQNLLEALAALRLKESVRILWVDALCIDQANSEEKSIQIPMMSQVYRRAEKVCIWLGQDTHNGAGIQFIKNEVLKLDSFDALGNGQSIGDKWRAINDMLHAPWFLRRWILQEILFARDAVVFYGSESIAWQDSADAVSLFLEVQNSASGLSNIMKKDPEYYRVPGWIDYIVSSGAGHMVSTSQSLFRISSDGQKAPLRDLESLVYDCQMFQNSEPRDTIYALLGLANDTAGMDNASLRNGRHLPNGQPIPIPEPRRSPQMDLVDLKAKAYPVNYAQSYASHCKDFIEFVVRRCSQIDSNRALDILCRPWASLPIKRRADDKRIPSWVSTITGAAFDLQFRPGMPSIGRTIGRKNADPLVGPPHANRSMHSAYYSASGDRGVDLSKLLFDERPDRYSLFVSGFIFDRVEHVELPSRWGCIPVNWLEAFGTCCGDADISISDKLWRTLVADRGPNGGTPPTYYKRACKEVIRKGGWECGAILLSDLINNGRNPLITNFCRRVEAVIWNRSLIRTRGGRFGMARECVSSGDLICILYGCSVPVTLRKHVKFRQEEAVGGQASIYERAGEEETFYELLGECYVHGIMDGEAIKFQEENGINSEVFDLW